MANYLPLSGGQMTGNIISRNTNGDVLQLRGGATYTTGSYLTLCGKDYSSSGVFTITAQDGTNSCTLRGFPSGSLTWGGKNVATESDLANYLPLSGGQMTGHTISRNTNSDFVGLYGGSAWNTGAACVLWGKDHPEYHGRFRLSAHDGTNYAELQGKPTGELYWCSHLVDTIEERGSGYIRYSSGLQICFGRHVAHANTDTYIALPKPFIDTNYISALTNHSGAGPVCSIASHNTITITGFSIKNIFGADVYVDVISIGRWK